MRRWVLLILAVALTLTVSEGAGSSAAKKSELKAAAPVFVTDKEVDLEVDSAAMGRPMRVKLILPRDWYGDPGQRFPVLYLLSGFGEDDNHDDWIVRTDVRQFLAEQNVLVVMPEAGAAGMYSNWWNYGAGGPPQWETFHTDELPAVLERDWRVSDRRGIAGISMGGFGAISYAARRPGTYAVVASLSGFPHSSSGLMQVFLHEVLRQEGRDPLALWGDPVANADIWAAHDPYVQAENLRGTALWISGGVGTHDPVTLDEIPNMTAQQLDEQTVGAVLEDLSTQNSAEFLTRLTELQISHTADFSTPGVHNWEFFQEQLHRAWPFLASGLGIPG